MCSQEVLRVDSRAYSSQVCAASPWLGDPCGALSAVFFIPECLPELTDLTDDELREALQTTMLRMLRVPS